MLTPSFEEPDDDGLYDDLTTAAEAPAPVSEPRRRFEPETGPRGGTSRRGVLPVVLVVAAIALGLTMLGCPNAQHRASGPPTGSVVQPSRPQRQPASHRAAKGHRVGARARGSERRRGAGRHVHADPGAAWDPEPRERQADLAGAAFEGGGAQAEFGFEQ